MGYKRRRQRKNDILLGSKAFLKENEWTESLDRESDEKGLALLQKRTPFMDQWDEFLKVFVKIKSNTSELSKLLKQ